MIVHLDHDSALPVFEQLRSQMERLIVSGQLLPGAKLPPIRHLAADLGLARGTVNKVYDALVGQGLVATSGRNGTIVLEPPHRITSTSDVASAADGLALVVTQLGLEPAAAHAALDAAIARLGPTNP